MAPDFEPFRLVRGAGVDVIDQTLLPLETRWVALRDVDALCEAIRSLRVRGAPFLGTMGACGMAIAGQTGDASDAALEAAAAAITGTRPTAVDLAVGVSRALAAVKRAGPSAKPRRAALWDHAEAMAEARRREDRAMGEHGASVIAAGHGVLTHCNTGGLATGSRGTALSAIRKAWEAGRIERCYVTETRPLLQGARLTTWELQHAGVPCTLLPDTAAASLIASGRVGAVVTGADRIAANGDTANKVGTYGLAALAARHGVPFVIVAPLTTVDADCPDGAAIPIEFRDSREVGGWGEVRFSPEDVAAYNPAFDVTPAELITAIVTEAGVLRPPFGPAIAELARGR